MNDLTKAQQRALEWLPKDGSWRIRPGRMTTALSSLSHAWPHCVEHEWGKFSARSAEGYRWRLNEMGVARYLETVRS